MTWAKRMGAVGAAMLLAVLAAGPTFAMGAARRTVVKVAHLQDGLNTSVVGNSWGLALYASTGDTNDQSSCYDTCTQVWKPLLAKGKVVAGRGIKQRLLGTTRRKDGTRQVTYNRHPLYLFVGKHETAGAYDGQGCDSTGQPNPFTTESHWWLLTTRGAMNKNESSLCQQGY